MTRFVSSARWSYLNWLLPALAAVVLYWPSLGLPLLYDDLLHIHIVKDLNWGNVWLPTTLFGFYRPLTFVPLLVIKGVFGYYPAWLLHGLNVGQHAVNSALLAGLVIRLRPRSGQALLAGLLFALYPFSYQAVAVYGHNVHPAITGVLLLLLHAALGGRWGWVAVLFVVGVLTHESAVLFGPLLGLVLLCRGGITAEGAEKKRGEKEKEKEKKKEAEVRTRRLGDWSKGRWEEIKKWIEELRPALWLTLAGVVYVLIYPLLPISRDAQATAGGGSWAAKLLYVLQGVAYPLLIPNRWLAAVPGAVVAVAAGVVVVLVVGWRWRQGENRPWLLLGGGWWGLAGIMAALPLSADYLLHGPRLLYLSSVGVVVLWSRLLAGSEERGERSEERRERSEERGARREERGAKSEERRAGREERGEGEEGIGWGWVAVPGFWVGVLLALPGALFVGGRLAAYGELTEPVGVVKEVMGERTAAEGVVFVNLPNSLVPAGSGYPIGVAGVSMLASYLYVEELVAENLGVERPVRAVLASDLFSDPGYAIDLHQRHQLPLAVDWTAGGSQVFVVHYRPEGVVTQHGGGLEPTSEETVLLATMGPYHLVAATAVACEGAVQATTAWTLAGEGGVPPSTTLFVQALDGNGALVAQADGPPLGLRADWVLLGHGWQVVDRRTLPLAGGEASELLVGVYDFVSGERYGGADGQGRPLGDGAFRLPIGPCRP